MEPLDDLITQKFLPNLLGSVVTEDDRTLFSLPVRRGGLGIPILSETCEMQFEHSMAISEPLKSLIIDQSNDLPNPENVKAVKSEKTKEKERVLKTKINTIDEKLSNET